jgi:DDE_Tnp_1-associated
MVGFRDSTTDERTSMANSTARYFATSPGDDGDLCGLLEALGAVREVRKARGRVFPLTFVLAVSLVAVLAGASNFREIGDHVMDLPGPLLGRLGARWCHFVLGSRCPSERTIRRVLGGVDADELDRVSGAWLRMNADVGADGVVTVAIDGKVLRGSWTGENKRFTLFSARLHESGVTLAQVEVPAGTNEITQVAGLLAVVPVAAGDRVVVTADAAHTQRETAEHVKGVRGFDYFLVAKGNQPTLAGSVRTRILPLLKDAPAHSVTERGHGRISSWETWDADAAGIDFPHVARVACIRRKVFTLAGECISKEYAWVLTSSTDLGLNPSQRHWCRMRSSVD